MKAQQFKTVLDRLGAHDDLASIKSALHTICSSVGSVRRLDVVLARQGDRRQALGFLRMYRAEHEQQVMRLLDIRRFAGELIIVVDLSRQVPRQRREYDSYGDRRSVVRDDSAPRRFLLPPVQH